ncbi:hypothetical protein TcYC6_0038490 [Trypanosoma cruzi]|nr:hypothetical protein TcYC6_0038490 [Trypanosoma cruzi]
MDRPLTPYELEVAICDSSLGSAPGHDNMLNEFLHHPGPVARGTLRTMIHNSFTNGSLPGSWNTVDTIPIPNLGRAIPPSELQTHQITLCFTTLKE